jgi:heme/copper-type cytochrome/quinol oxidase subunit 3
LNIFWGTLNTAVLITSSFTMAMGVWCAETAQAEGAGAVPVLTFILGIGFLGIKTVEYKEKIEKHHVPGFHYSLQSFIDPASDPEIYKEYHDKPLALDMARHTEVYFSLYFAMTGMHALHMIIGIAILGFMIFPRPGRGLHGGARHICREFRPVLALCRHHLDFPFPAALPDQPTPIRSLSHDRSKRNGRIGSITSSAR